MEMKKIMISLVLSCLAWMAGAQNGAYTWNLELGGRVNVGESVSGGELNVATTHGFLFEDGFFMGGGAGISPMLHSRGFSIPLFAEARYSIPGWSIHPFVALRGGLEYTFSAKLNRALDLSAFFAAPALGVDFDGFFVRMSYWLQGGGNAGNGLDNPGYSVKFQQVGLSFGYTF